MRWAALHVAVLSSGLLAAGAVVAEARCHIHPPGSTPERPVGTVGPYDDLRACEEARTRRFGAEGRCHCTADFTPRRFLPGPGRTQPADPSQLM